MSGCTILTKPYANTPPRWQAGTDQCDDPKHCCRIELNMSKSRPLHGGIVAVTQPRKQAATHASSAANIDG